ncbi:MFS general substrate transporter [Suillus occidentalis]|nr:MFS general substrate transporter [Suillus occidentalis]
MSDAQVEIEKLGSSEDSGSQRAEIFERPTGWRGYYHHPVTQVSMLGLVCFMCPGMFNALSGLGGGGQVNTTDQANANATLYATFAFFGFFSGSVNNVLGARRTLMLGTWGYSLYIAAFLAVNIHPGAGAFVVASGAILGICAAFLWTAQGSLMMSYPTEAQKGMFISIFWAIFNLGGVVGSAVAFGNNFKSTANSVGNGTYVGFLILTLIGVFLPLLMVDPDKMIRTDGTRVNLVRHPSWKTEFFSLFVALKTDPWIILLFPMFLASNYFYTWQFNDYNGAIFNIRARGLNNFVYWTSQIFGSIFIGYFVLDQKRVRRRVRAFYGWILVFFMIFSCPRLGILLPKLAVFTGFYKAMQSTGAAGVWAADGAKVLAGMIFAAPMVYLRVTDHTEIEDETLMQMAGVEPIEPSLVVTAEKA